MPITPQVPLKLTGGSIRHAELARGRSRITYVFQFTARPRTLKAYFERSARS